MRTSLITAALIATSLLSGRVDAAVTYTFDFKNMSNRAADFSISLVYDDYLTSTGMRALTRPLATSLGYGVSNAGTNRIGWWGFSQAGGFMSDTGFSYSDTSFLFLPDRNQTGYFMAPGIYNGRVMGNAAVSFQGLALLTVSSDAVPEASTWAMMIVGMGVAGYAMRRRPRVRGLRTS